MKFSKIKNAAARVNEPPFNPFYEEYKAEFDKIFEQRAPVTFEHNSGTYVEMPVIENEVLKFALARSSDVGMIVGATGIGKSSLVRYLEHSWGDHDCWVIVMDLAQIQIAGSLPRGFHSLSQEAQLKEAGLAARQVVDLFIKQKLWDFLQTTAQEHPNELFNFAVKYMPGILPASVLFDFGQRGTISRKAATKILKSLATAQEHDFLSLGVVFKLLSRNIPHLKIIIDNVDDKDVLLVHEIVDTFSHLQERVRVCNEKERGEIANATPRSVTLFVTCRPPTATELTWIDEGSPHAWQGIRELPIVRPCNFAHAIAKRYAAFSRKRPRPVTIVASPGKWQFGNRDEVFQKLCELIESNRYGEHILALANNNVATAMSLMLELLRHKEVIDVDSFVKSESIIGGAGQTLSWSKMVKALAFGNQGSRTPIYPVRNTVVVNILEGKNSALHTTLFKPRLLRILQIAQTDDGNPANACTLKELCDYGMRWFNVSCEQAKALLNEMFQQGLVIHGRGSALPGAIGDDCNLRMTTRASFLLESLDRNDVLLKCFRDDIDLKEDIAWHGKKYMWVKKPTADLSVAETARELVWMSWQAFAAESQEVYAVAERGEYQEFVRVSGKELISQLIVFGIVESNRTFYGTRPFHGGGEEWDHDQLTSRLKALQEEISGFYELVNAIEEARMGDHKKACATAKRISAEVPDTDSSTRAEGLRVKWEEEAVKD